MDNEEEDHTIDLTSHTLHPIEQEYAFSEEEGYEYDVHKQRYNVHMVEQQVFSDYDKNDDESYPYTLSQSSKYRIRRPIEEEIK